MKIPFNIKFRPQIESGEYKVETRDGRPVRVICWDRIATEPFDNCNIVALVPGTKSKSESTYYYYQDGHLWNKANDEGDSVLDLFIITPEPELTEFEATLLSYLSDDTSGELDKETMHKCVKARAAELLELAKKELCKDCRVSLDSYAKGRLDEIYKREKDYKYEGPTIPAFWPPCHYGGECTNPFHDCINCHRQSTDGISTTTGTSTAKVEG